MNNQLKQLLLLSIILSFLLFPHQCLTKKIYLDSHSHAKYTQPDEFWTPEESIVWHKQNGYNAMIINNHQPDEYIEPHKITELNSYGDFIVLPGREYSPSNFHLVVIFDPSTYLDIYPALPILIGANPECITEQELIEFVYICHSVNALVVLAHPHLTQNICNFKPSITFMKNIGIDLVERVTAGIFDFGNQKEEEAVRFRVVAGTDGHNRHKVVPGAYTIIITPQNFTDKALFMALKDGIISIEYDIFLIGWRYYVLLSIIISSAIVLFVISGLVVICCYTWCCPFGKAKLFQTCKKQNINREKSAALDSSGNLADILVNPHTNPNTDLDSDTDSNVKKRAQTEKYLL